jgi:hypothetical protein
VGILFTAPGLRGRGGEQARRAVLDDAETTRHAR